MDGPSPYVHTRGNKMEKINIKTKKQRKTVTSTETEVSEDELLASSQETVINLSGSEEARHSTLLPTKNTNAIQQDTKSGVQLKKKAKKRKSQRDILRAKYAKAKFILDKIAKNEANGTPDVRDEEDRVKYQAVVDEHQKLLDALPSTSQKAEKRNRSQTGDEKAPKKRRLVEKSLTPQATAATRRPFNEVVKGHLNVALANSKDGRMCPVVAEWGAIESKLAELVMEYVLENKGKVAPRFDSGEVHRGYRIIKCLDESSKEFLGKCITKISDAWVGLSLKLIPAEEIPMRPRARVWLPKMVKEAKQMLECLQAQNPNISMVDWGIIRAEQTETSTCLTLVITEEGAAQLEKAGSKLFFGVRDAKVKVFRPAGPGISGADELEAANNLLTGMRIMDPEEQKST